MSPWRRRFLWSLGVIGMVYGIVVADVLLRGREAYLEGEKYWRWSEHPEERRAYVEAQTAPARARLDRRHAEGALDDETYARDLELLQFDREQRLKESTIKYAYAWYQTAADLFTPPESKWTRLSRQKMPLAKERWKAELRAQGIPVAEYRID